MWFSKKRDPAAPIPPGPPDTFFEGAYYDAGTDSYWLRVTQGTTPLPDYIKAKANGWIREKDGKVHRMLTEIKRVDPISGMVTMDYGFMGETTPIKLQDYAIKLPTAQK